MRRSDDQAIPGSAQLGPVLSELLSVANIAALAPLTYGDGTTIFVRSVRDFWTYRAGSTTTPDAITVVAHASGTGRWERLCIPHPSWGRQTTIYIHATLGNDESDGTADGASALKTNAELVRRLGRVYAPVIAQTVNVTGDPGDLLWDVRKSNNTAGWVNYMGSLVQQTTATITGVTNQDAATNTDAQFACATGWTASAEVDRLVVDSSGLSGWVIEQGATAADTVVSTWVSNQFRTSPDVGSGLGTGNTATSRTVTTYTHGCSLASSCVAVTAGALHFTDVTFSGNNRFFAVGDLYLNRCILIGATFRAAAGTVFLHHCLGKGSINNPVGNDFSTRTIVNTGLYRVPFSSGGTTSPSNTTLRTGVIFTGTGFGLVSNSGRVALDGTVWFRKVTGSQDLVGFITGGTGRINGGISGSGNTTTGKVLNLARGTSIAVAAAQIANIKVTTAGGDISIAGATSSYALDPTTGAALAARNFTFALLNASIATGWAGSMTNPTVVGAVVIQ